MTAPTSPWLRAHLPAIAWAAAIWGLLMMPAADVERLEPWLPSWLPPQGPVGVDKLVHLGLFTVLGWLLWRSLRTRLDARRAALLAVVLASLYGGVTEIVQGLATDRAAELGDFGADTAGAALGAWVMVRGVRSRPPLG